MKVTKQPTFDAAAIWWRRLRMVAASAWEYLLDNGIQMERQVRRGWGAERTKGGSCDRGYPCEGAIRAQPHGLVCGGRINRVSCMVPTTMGSKVQDAVATCTHPPAGLITPDTRQRFLSRWSEPGLSTGGAELQGRGRPRRCRTCTPRQVVTPVKRVARAEWDAPTLSKCNQGRRVADGGRHQVLTADGLEGCQRRALTSANTSQWGRSARQGSDSWESCVQEAPARVAQQSGWSCYARKKQQSRYVCNNDNEWPGDQATGEMWSEWLGINVSLEQRRGLVLQLIGLRVGGAHVLLMLPGSDGLVDFRILEARGMTARWAKSLSSASLADCDQQNPQGDERNRNEPPPNRKEGPLSGGIKRRNLEEFTKPPKLRSCCHWAAALEMTHWLFSSCRWASRMFLNW